MDRAELARLLGTEPAAGEPRDVTITEADPGRFMEAFGRGVAAGGRVFLADPTWGTRERAQFANLVDRPVTLDPRGWLCVPTGGSSGALKLARHDEETIASAVRGFTAHFGAGPVNAIGVLPLHHVSGLMAWMRCLLTGGVYQPWDGRALLSGARPELGAGAWYLSLVPTQLARLLADDEAVAWLRGFRAVFVGGGPAWPAIVEAGARLGLPLAFSYGMTETAAMATALRPGEFLNGARSSGHALPHVRVDVDAQGVICIDGPSLFRGYHPGTRAAGPWSTGDLGRLDENGQLHVLGRRDGFIITGGEKVDPAEVEGALRATGVFDDVVVVGVPDAEWGEAVVACYPERASPPDLENVRRSIETSLAPFKQPKRYVAIADWQRNEHGKVNRAALRAALGEV
jgi:O-succinylbenzoic acid--CoA ligase